MIISLIVAAAENGVIGRDGKLPWQLPDDLKHFREITSGHVIIMGRKTYESIGRPLPNRQNIVITRQKNWSVEGVEIAHSLDEALKIIPSFQSPGRKVPRGGPRPLYGVPSSLEVFIIGGGEIYKQALPLSERIYLTRVQAELEGDAFFPALNPEDWKEVSREDHPADEKNQYPFTFFVYERVPR